MRLKKVTFVMLKTDSGEIIVDRQSKFNQQLASLAPGKYKGVLEKEDVELTRLKKYYFAMESSLAHHLGMKKTELHLAVRPFLGQMIDEESGKMVYQSIRDIRDKDTMMARVLEFQEWAARMHDYTFEPFKHA